MTVTEFLFLAIGLILGMASGIGLIEVVRARPPARREVLLTVSTDAVPRRRATTLADDAFIAVGPEPARGGPGDRRGMEGAEVVRTPDRRTSVLNAGTSPGRAVGMPISEGADPVLGAFRASVQNTDRPAASAKESESRRPGAGTAGRAVAVTVTATVSGTRAEADIAVAAESKRAVPAADEALDPSASSPMPARYYAGPCAEERRLADERCEVATRAQARASATADALRRAQRSYDAHTKASTAAAEAAHPRDVRNLKEGAQRDFRVASRAAGTRENVEDAAREWLHEINRINREFATATRKAEREREAAASVGATLERLSLEADAARVGSDMADAACLAARAAVAECDEGSTANSVAAPASTPAETEPGTSAVPAIEALGIALEAGSSPRIFRLLRGDPAAMNTLVATLAGDDLDEQRRWKLRLASLLDAILADAIEQAFLRFPHDHAFWGPYTQQQNRDVARALASLGHRFDGMGGWADERLPTQRELSLALGYAGLDPMRMRQWPTEAQTAALFRDVEVAADEYLAGAAGDLTLAEMVGMLGRRADNLVELWNQWGRLRPLLLD